MEMPMPDKPTLAAIAGRRLRAPSRFARDALPVLVIAMCLFACTVGTPLASDGSHERMDAASAGARDEAGGLDEGGDDTDVTATDATTDQSDNDVVLSADGGADSTAATDEDAAPDQSTDEASITDSPADVSVGDDSAAGDSGDDSGGGDDGGDDGGGGGDDGGGDGGAVDNDGGITQCVPVHDNPGALVPGPALTADELAQTYAAIDDIVQANESLPDRQAYVAAVQSALAGVPHLADSGIASDCTVWMRFTDGTSSFILRDRTGFGPSDPDPLADAPDGSAPVGASRRGPARSTRANPNTNERATPPNIVPVPAAAGDLALPGSGKAYIGYSHSLAPTALPRVQAALQNRGYAVTTAPGLKLANLTTDVANVGVLWLSTHGGTSYDLYGRPHYWITTDDPVDPRTGVCLGTFDDCSVASRERLAGHFISGWIDAPIPGTRSVFGAIDDEFIQAYWPLAPNSLVFIDACDSLEAFPAQQAFQKALFGTNSGTMLGWVDTVTAGFAEQTVMFFFDRMLGGKSKYTPAGRYQPLSPPQRPFSAGEVYASMKANHRIKDPDGNAVLAIAPNAAADSILVPSIRNLGVGNFAQRETEKAAGTNLYLYGEFGGAKGTVEIAGTAVAPAEWTSRRITLVLPNPTSMGTVQAKVTVGTQTITGNIVPLTRWSGSYSARWTLLASIGPPGPFTELRCSAMHLRGDIHLFRMAPEGVALAGTATDSTPFQQRIDFGSTTSDSVCGGATGGSGVQGTGPSSDTQSFTDTGDQYANLPWLEQPLASPPGAPTWWEVVRGSIDTSTYRLTVIWGGFVYTTLTITSNDSPPDYPPQVMPNTLYAMGSAYVNAPDIQLTLPAAGSDAGALGATGTQFTIISGGDKEDIQYNISVESGSAPDSDTEG
jgi:hypothetical protein